PPTRVGAHGEAHERGVGVEVAEAARDPGRLPVAPRARVEADDARPAAEQRVGRGEADDPRADDGDIDLDRAHPRRNPPSACTTWPVTHPASSEHRNATSAAARSRRTRRT